MDKAAILGDAIDYIKELENKARNFQAELKEMEEEDCSKDNGGSEILELKGSYEDTKHPLANENILGSAVADQNELIPKMPVSRSHEHRCFHVNFHSKLCSSIIKIVLV